MKEDQRVAGSLVDVGHAPAVDALEIRLVWPLLVRAVALLPMYPFPFSSSKEDHSLAVEAWEPDNSTQGFAVHEIEDDDFVLGHAVELAVWPEA